MIKNTLTDLLHFLKKPNDKQVNLSAKQKIKFLLILLFAELLITFVIILPLDSGINELILIKTDKFDYKTDTFSSTFLFFVLIIPFLEEVFFRYFLRYKGIKSRIISRKNWDVIFPYLVYLFTVSFGFIHVSNYLNTDIVFYLISPLLIFSQLFGGLIITYIRVRSNFLMGIYYHCIWNFIFAIAIPVLEYQFSKPYTEKTEKYNISIIEKPFFNKEEEQTIKIDSMKNIIKKIEVKQYSLQSVLDTLSNKNKYYVDDILIDLSYNSKNGISKEEFIKILRKEYEIN